MGSVRRAFVHSRAVPWAAPSNMPARWVVFSDLHVSHGTLAVCEEVLARTHAEAHARGAGILFLGDFFHVRGSLRVEQLNRVLQSLRLWGDTPCIMIPGNHDQVDVDGSTHALTPLSFALERCKIISQSEVFLGALWLPYRRDLQQLHDSIAKAFSEDATQSIAAPRPRAIFCHADVAGASMSAGIRGSRFTNPSLCAQARAYSHPITRTGHRHARARSWPYTRTHRTLALTDFLAILQLTPPFTRSRVCIGT